MKDLDKRIDAGKVMMAAAAIFGLISVGEVQSQDRSSLLPRGTAQDKFGPEDATIPGYWKQRYAAFDNYEKALFNGLKGLALEEFARKVSKADYEYGSALRRYEQEHKGALYPDSRVMKSFEDIDRRVRSGKMSPQEIEAEITAFSDTWSRDIDRISFKAFFCGYYGVCQTN